MSLKTAWIWYGVWFTAVALSCSLIGLPRSTLGMVLALVFVALQLPVGIGLTQYAIWSNRHRLGRAWSLFLMIPPTLAVQAMWVPIVLFFDGLMKMDPYD